MRGGRSADRYREHLDESPEARETLESLRDRLEAGESIALVCFEIPSVLAIGLVIAGAQLVTLSRYYVGTGRYRELTASMVLEVQMKYYAIYLCFFSAIAVFAVVTFLLIEFGLPASVSNSIGLGVWKAVVAGTVLTLKLAFERSRFRGERQPDLDDDSFTANFSPTPPATEDAT